MRTRVPHEHKPKPTSVAGHPARLASRSSLVTGPGAELSNRTLKRMVASRAAPDPVQRETKSTEKEVLNEAQQTGGLTNEGSEKLTGKMDKSQSFANARKIAAEIETESEALVSRLPRDQQADVRAAIKDYVSASTAIQTSARGDPAAISQAVQNLDAALQAIQQQITADAHANERIVYRSITYGSPAEIPYGQQAGGHQVQVGDFVGDKGFLSTSEHRQFIAGSEQTGTVNGMLKVAIYSKSGIPIALDFPLIAYSNPNLKALYQGQQKKKWKLVRAWNAVFGAGARAGQAEVLFPRDTVFEVKKIQPKDTEVSVVLEEFTGPRPATVKNMKFGSPL